VVLKLSPVPADACRRQRCPPYSGGWVRCRRHRCRKEPGMPQLSDIDEVLRESTDCGDVPGVVAMAASRDGPIYEGAFGRRALPDGAAMTVDTVFWIASMTKAITSTA